MALRSEDRATAGRISPCHAAAIGQASNCRLTSHLTPSRSTACASDDNNRSPDESRLEGDNSKAIPDDRDAGEVRAGPSPIMAIPSAFRAIPSGFTTIRSGIDAIIFREVPRWPQPQPSPQVPPLSVNSLETCGFLCTNAVLSEQRRVRSRLTPPPHSDTESDQGPRLGPFFFLFQRALAGPSALRRLGA